MLKKVAILLPGTIGRKNKSLENIGDIYNKELGDYVNYNACYKSIIKYIVKENPDYEFDFFAHLWCYDLSDEIKKLYDLKDYLFEDNRIYVDEIKKWLDDVMDYDIDKIRDKYGFPVRFSYVSFLLSIKKVGELLENYVKETNKNYDRVIIYRPDVLLYKPIRLSNYDFNTIYCNAPSTNGDFHFIMSFENMKTFTKGYDYISKELKPACHFFHQEFVSKILNKNIGIGGFVGDSINPPFDQEVMRKIDLPIHNGYISKEDIEEFGLKVFKMIVVATHNDVRYLNQIVDNLLNIDLNNHEVLVIDTNSGNPYFIEEFNRISKKTPNFIFKRLNYSCMDSGAYIYAFQNYNSDSYIFIQDSINIKNKNYIKIHDEKLKSFDIVAFFMVNFMEFNGGNMDDDIREWIYDDMNFTEFPKKMIFGPMFSATKQILDKIPYKSLKIPTNYSQRLSMESRWSLIFHTLNSNIYYIEDLNNHDLIKKFTSNDGYGFETKYIKKYFNNR